jgi:transcription initiation factor TFIIB
MNPIHYKNLNHKLICAHCKINPPNIIEVYLEGNLVCGDCGLVLENRLIDFRSDCKAYTQDDIRSSRYEYSYNNEILDDVNIKTNNDNKFKPLLNTHNKIIGKKNSPSQSRYISVISGKMGLTQNVINTIFHLYKNINNKINDKKINNKKINNKKIYTLVLIYFACKLNNVARSINEICTIGNITKKEFNKYYKILSPHFKIDNNILYESYIIRYINQLDLPEHFASQTINIAKKIQNLGILTGKSTISIIAACIYFTVNLQQFTISIDKISSIVDCTPQTITKLYNIIQSSRDQIL